MTLEIILALIVVGIAVLAIVNYARARARVSRLIYMILPPYEVPDLLVAGGVLVENRGSAPAREVKIALRYPDAASQKIRHLQVMSDVEYVQQSGGENEPFVTLSAREIAPDQKLIIYFSGPTRVLPQVTVTQGIK